LNKNILQEIDIRIAAVGLSLLVSFFTSSLTILPNDDAYTYVRTAEIFLNEGINAAIQHYTWAGYSLLIALISKLGLDLFNAAYLIKYFTKSRVNKNLFADLEKIIGSDLRLFFYNQGYM